MTQPTLGRQVTALEKELDVILFDRVGKQLILTPSGLELVEHIRSMADAANRVSMAASGQSQQLDGEVCVTAIDIISVYLLAKKVGNLRGRLYGTPEYLDQLGRPAKPQRLSNANLTSYNRSQATVDMFQQFGSSVSPDNFPVISESLLLQWELTKRGMCLGMMIESIGDNEPKVERVLPDADVNEFPVWLVAHHQLRSSQRVRVVYDMLADKFGSMC